MSKQIHLFFDENTAYQNICKKDNLADWNKIIDWAPLEKIMKEITFNQQTNGGKGGRLPICEKLMCRILILQSSYNLSDDGMEFAINDRLSFKRFLGLDLTEKSPDAKTIWVWRERLKKLGLHEKLFRAFEESLQKEGFASSKGQMIDATFVPTHKPTGKHKKQIEEGKTLSQKQKEQICPDATFTKKGGQTYHGFKNHVCVDVQHKLIRAAHISTASLHDSQIFEDILSVPAEEFSFEDRRVFADSAYKSKKSDAWLKEKNMTSHICERAYRKKPLSENQKKNNFERSKIRSRIEHVFGFMETSMGGMAIHTMGLARAQVKITFKNLAYNMRRLIFLVKQRAKHA